MHEALRIVQHCLNDEEFSFHGKYWIFENVRMTPKPVQKPLPLWVAAMLLNALEEAGRNGYHLAGAPPAAQQRIYADALLKAGHNPAHFIAPDCILVTSPPLMNRPGMSSNLIMQWHMKIHFRAIAAPVNQRFRQGRDDLTVPALGELRERGQGSYGPACVGTPHA
ncbi:MAG: LLM class flavin-dependent oxidoreductase [Candidatus Binataceae bacterium]